MQLSGKRLLRLLPLCCLPYYGFFIRLWSSSLSSSNTARKIAVPLIVLLVAYGLGQLLLALKPDAVVRPAVDFRPQLAVQTVQLESLLLELGSQGSVQARQQIEVISEVSGRVISVDPTLTEGGLVAKGQTLLHIDPIAYQVAVAEARAALAQAELNLEDERREMKRAAEYRSNNTMSVQSQRKHKLAVVETEHVAAKERLRRAEQELGNTVINTPFAAVIRDKQVDIGQYVSAGNKIFSLLGSDRVEVRLPITASQIAYLAPLAQTSRRVVLQANFGSHRQQWQGRITRLEAMVDTETRVFYAVAEVDNNPEVNPVPLSIGLFVDALIEGQRVDGKVRMPASALHGDDVFVVVDGHLQRRGVSVFRRERDQVIVGGGLQAGDQLVLSRLDLMVEGMEVTVAESTVAPAAPTNQ